MSDQFNIKQNDTLPKIGATLWQDEAKTIPMVLTSAQAVNFHMMERSQLDAASPVLVVEATAEVVDALLGKVEYTWVQEDTEDDGTYYGEFEVEWSDTDRTTWPNNDYIVIIITKDLDKTNE
jgi:hypothetical protein